MDPQIPQPKVKGLLFKTSFFPSHTTEGMAVLSPNLGQRTTESGGGIQRPGLEGDWGSCHSADIYGRSHVVGSGKTQNTLCTVAPDKASPQRCGEPTALRGLSQGGRRRCTEKFCILSQGRSPCELVVLQPAFWKASPSACNCASVVPFGSW